MTALRWSYGVTTVPSRRGDLLPATLQSLALAGFDHPRLFIDGCDHRTEQEYHHLFGRKEGPPLETTARWPTIRTAMNWTLGLYELYLREPAADRFALFQDDFLAYRNLRQYLEYWPYPERGYQNLYLFESNAVRAPKGNDGKPRVGWYESATLNADTTDQTGRGAVALVFSREAVQTLLSSRYLVERPTDAHNGWRKIDGGIVTAMNRAGWREWVHWPSLTQHMGRYSVMGSRPHKQAESFIGENYDALDLLKGIVA